MSATALNVKITTSAELQALKATEQELLRQITAAKAAGKSLKDIGQEMKQLAGVQARMKEMGFVGRMQAEIQDMLTKIPALGRVMTAANGGAGLQTSGLGVLAGAAVAARSALAAFRRIEDLQTTFVTLLGSVDAAKKRIAELSKFAAETPFTLPEIARGEKPIGKLAITDDEILLPSVARMRVKAIRRDTETRTVWIELQERGMR